MFIFDIKFLNMKKYLIFLSILFFTNIIIAQDTNKNFISFKPLFLIYSNFYQGLLNNANETNIDIRRAYLGCDFFLSDGFSGYIKVDIGSPDERLNYSLLRRNAYIKNVGIAYNIKNTRFDIGIIDNFQHKTQERFWGKRYIYKSFLDEHSFFTSTDIGISLSHNLFKNYTLNLSITNSEYSSNQIGYKKYIYSFGMDYKYKQTIKARIFSSYNPKINNTIITGIFVGYNYKEKFKFAGEFNLKNIFKENSNLTIYGISTYSAYVLNQKFNIFIRYDVLRSNILQDMNIPWNLSKDGSALIAGFEYKHSENVKFSINYQDWYPLAANLQNKTYLFFNIEFGIFESYKRI